MVEASGIRLGDSITGLDQLTTSTNNLISIVLILVFTAMYPSPGLRAVVQTDVMQFSVAMLGTLAYAWFVVDAAGGLGG